MIPAPVRLNDPGPVIVLKPSNHASRCVRWGQRWQVGTAAYWVALTQEYVRQRVVPPKQCHRIGRTLVEEVAACLLGGHGIHHTVGLAAFEAVRAAGLLDAPTTEEEIEQVLRSPLYIGEHTVHYRFPRQKAAFLSVALRRLHESPPPESAPALRAWLLELPGIGPKTSGWIVRNFHSSDDVAIIDIHILRAGVEAGVFDASWTPARDYPLLEELFLAWAAAGGVNAGDLDEVVWSERARAPRAYSGAY